MNSHDIDSNMFYHFAQHLKLPPPCLGPGDLGIPLSGVRRAESRHWLIHQGYRQNTQCRR